MPVPIAPPKTTATAAAIAGQVRDLAQRYLASANYSENALAGLFGAALGLSPTEARQTAQSAMRFGNNMAYEVGWYFECENGRITNDEERATGLERLRSWIASHPPNHPN